jgi:hypothetical protein
MLVRDSHARIGNHELDLLRPCGPFSTDRHAAPGRCEFDRIVEEVDEQLLES